MVSPISIVLALDFCYVVQFVDFAEYEPEDAVDIQLKRHIRTSSMAYEPEVLETKDGYEE